MVVILSFFQNADRFSNEDNELQWTACLSLYVRETGLLKYPGGLPIMAYTETAAGASARKGNLFREKWYIKG